MKLYELNTDGTVKEIDRLPGGLLLSCAFGCFDGVHIGHRALLQAAVNVANDLKRCISDNTSTADHAVIPHDTTDIAPAVWTFSEPVSKPWIISVPQRLAICGELGIKYAICEDFEAVRGYSPEEFIEALVNRVGLYRAVCGYDFRFGNERRGDAKTLGETLANSLKNHYGTDLCNGAFSEPPSEKHTRSIGAFRYGAATVIGEIDELGAAVSSTRIRKVISDGDMDAAKALLGRPYSMKGQIVSGKQLGRTFSRPTANLHYSADQLIPRRGVYFTLCRIGKKSYRSVTNVGSRPTVNNDTSDVTCEVHILDFEQVIYGEETEIEFLKFARPEIAFTDTAALAKQIENDVFVAIDYFSELGL